MKYNLSKQIDKQRFKARCNELYEASDFIELRKINYNRDRSQDNYMHLIISWFAIFYGETTAYCKEEFFKKTVNKAIFETTFTNRLTGEQRIGLRSTEVLDTTEKTLAIDRFRDWSSKEHNYYLPEPNEKEYLMEVEAEMDRMKQYL